MEMWEIQMRSFSKRYTKCDMHAQRDYEIGSDNRIFMSSIFMPIKLHLPEPSHLK